MAQQFQLLMPCTLTSIKLMLAMCEGYGLTGTAVLKIYASDGDFRDEDSIPTGSPIATSTNTLDVSTLENIDDGGDWTEVEFAFDEDELEAGVYFVALEVDDVDTNEYASALAFGDDDTGWYDCLGAGLGSFAWYDGGEEVWVSCYDLD